jgi:hypothetical protein
MPTIFLQMLWSLPFPYFTKAYFLWVDTFHVTPTSQNHLHLSAVKWITTSQYRRNHIISTEKKLQRLQTEIMKISSLVFACVTEIMKISSLVFACVLRTLVFRIEQKWNACHIRCNKTGSNLYSRIWHPIYILQQDIMFLQNHFEKWSNHWDVIRMTI